MAAARCRKRRLDQTNSLTNKTKELEKEHNELVENLKSLLGNMNALKRHIEEHEGNCGSFFRNLRFRTDLFRSLDFEALAEAMKPLYDDDNLSEPDTPPSSDHHQENHHNQPIKQEVEVTEFPKTVASSISSNNNLASTQSVFVSDNSTVTATVEAVSNSMFNSYDGLPFSQQQHNLTSTSTIESSSSSINYQHQKSISSVGFPAKRRRPNTLSVISSYNLNESSNNDTANNSNTANTSNPNALQTPSNGYFDSTGLTPLMPTLTPSELTPSTMAVFVKSLQSP